MTPQLEEAGRLLRLAQRDAVAFRVLLAAPEADAAIACFHAQQAVEKSLKAVACVRRVAFRRTHDLEELAARLGDAGAAIPVSAEVLRRPTPFAVEFRYNDEAIDTISGKEAGEIMRDVIRWAECELSAASGRSA